MADRDLLEDAAVGDIVLIDDAIEGRVLFNSFNDEFSFNYNKEGYLAPGDQGILIEQDNGAKIFHDANYLLKDYCRLSILSKKKHN